MYRVRNIRSGLFVVKIAEPRPKHAGDTRAYYRFTLNDDEATQFGNWCDADMSRIMLGFDWLEILDKDGNRITHEQAQANGTFHSF